MKAPLLVRPTRPAALDREGSMKADPVASAAVAQCFALETLDKTHGQVVQLLDRQIFPFQDISVVDERQRLTRS